VVAAADERWVDHDRGGDRVERLHHAERRIGALEGLAERIGDADGEIEVAAREVEGFPMSSRILPSRSAGSASERASTDADPVVR
jgi:hypothetical protein